MQNVRGPHTAVYDLPVGIQMIRIPANPGAVPQNSVSPRHVSESFIIRMGGRKVSSVQNNHNIDGSKDMKK